MKLEGIHHITAITGDAQRNLDFYNGVLGLRFVKRTVNHDDTEVYHLYYASDHGDPGSVMTFFVYPGIPEGRAGAGMVHTLLWRVADEAALDFWEARLGGEGLLVGREGGVLRSADPEGLAFELVATDVSDRPLTATAADIPEQFALQGFHGARAYTTNPLHSAEELDSLRFTHNQAGYDGGDHYLIRGDERHAHWIYDQAPEARGIAGAGTVHHIAWASQASDHTAWRDAARTGGAHPTPVIDRIYFRSIYFREPSGVLFEIATLGPGFTADEPLEHLGETLVLPPGSESHRAEIERSLPPLEPPVRA